MSELCHKREELFELKLPWIITEAWQQCSRRRGGGRNFSFLAKISADSAPPQGGHILASLYCTPSLQETASIYLWPRTDINMAERVCPYVSLKTNLYKLYSFVQYSISCTQRKFRKLSKCSLKITYSIRLMSRLFCMGMLGIAGHSWASA
jgi:hypothetical protein